MMGSRKSGLGLFAVLVPALGLMVGCTPQGDPAVAASGFKDGFDGERLGEHWNNTGGPYRIVSGELHVRGARNKPLWLRRTLPRDVKISFDVRSESPDGDIKVEVYGDGVSKAESESYTATSYVIIFGGWGNSLNVIARMNEHGSDRVVGQKRKVELGQRYAVEIERRGGQIRYSVDGDEIAVLDDDAPLYGRGHDHFAFNNWMSDVFFDNLAITPL